MKNKTKGSIAKLFIPFFKFENSKTYKLFWIFVIVWYKTSVTWKTSDTLFLNDVFLLGWIFNFELRKALVYNLKFSKKEDVWPFDLVSLIYHPDSMQQTPPLKHVPDQFIGEIGNPSVVTDSTPPLTQCMVHVSTPHPIPYDSLTPENSSFAPTFHSQ